MARLDENPQHTCIHEDKWKDHDRRLNTLETDLKEDMRDLKNDVKDTKNEISNLRNDLNLNKQQNGYQDKELDTIKQAEQDRQKAHDAMVRDIIKLIAGFALGIISSVIIYYILH